MATECVATISFRDDNMPNVGVVCASYEAAVNELARLLRTYASVKGGWITRPDESKVVFSSTGEYMFTVPKI